MKDLTIAEVIDAEAYLRQAMLASDVEALEMLLSDELIFTNHMGLLLTKEADLSMHRTGLVKFWQLEPSEQKLVVRHPLAIVSVKMRTEGSYAGSAFSLLLRYTRTWSVDLAGSWQVLAGHSSVVQSD